MQIRYLLPVMLAGLSGMVCASASAPVAEPSMAGSMLQVFLVLLFVLGLIIVAAWLMRRFSLLPTAAGRHLRVVSGIMVGQRERVVIVEVQGQWLVLGVTAQNVNLLSSLPKPEDATSLPSNGPPFAEWLGRALQKRIGGVSGDVPVKK